ncbi:unnamed protein product [marine sediment metagenome]|uniref:LmbE family protein n=1 Tax=marine sediment metagenome TaxID=412755 RepID=X1AX42_9ZZZZ
MNKPDKILVLSPHPDDGEIGCGGTIARFVREGKQIVHILFSPAEKIGSKIISKHIRWREFDQSNELLGVHQACRPIAYEHRNLALHRSRMLDFLVGLRRQTAFDAVFMPCLHDIHQDHAVVAHEALRVFKGIDIFCYEMPWNNLNFNTQCFIKIEEQDLRKKIQALSFYETQQHKAYMNPKFIESWAITRGVQCGSVYAEAFENIKRII